ncbi:MAG: polysaccharide biosynthesis tyrosine autokinase [Chloroflexota bacterium]|nr:polysaccharide biosynthesis tyrosine autokinase [Chloroflexota bacterium]
MDSRVIRQYLRVITRWWWLLVVSAVIPMAVSYYFASQQQDLYQAKVTIVVGASVFQDPDPDQTQMRLSNTLAAAYAELLRQGPVTAAVIERLGLERSPERLAEQIGTRIYSGAQLLEIQVTDSNPEAAALIANALADELIRRSPASGKNDPEQQEFIRSQLEELQVKIAGVSEQINDLTASLSELTSAAEIQDTQERIAAFEDVKSTYQSTYADLLNSYQAESPNVLSLFEPAVIPQWPIPSKAKLIVAVAGAAGVGLALGAVFLMEFMDTSLRWEGEGVQSILDIPVLGAVPQVSRRDTLSSDNPLSPVAEGVRAVRASIFLMRPDNPFKTLLLTSPGAAEGKSFVLANLAVVLASAGNRVIAVDADMRRPSLHELFDLPNITGLADVLGDYGVEGDGGDSLSVPLQETDFDNLLFLPAGRPPVDPATLLTSSRFPALLEFLGDQGDVVLIDSPPVLGLPDATVMATLVDGTILVASVGITRRELVQGARDRLLTQQGVNLLGLTVNRAKLDGSYYYAHPGRGEHGEADGDEEWLTLGEAAARLGISKDQARRWCKSGRLPAVRKGLRWQVDPDGLKRMLADTWEIRLEAQR